MTTRMINVANTLAVSGIIGFGAAVGTAIDVNRAITQDTPIPLGSAIAVAVVLLGLSWHISSWKKGITDSLEELKRGQEALGKRLDTLPYSSRGCKPKKKKNNTP